ncbi:MAG: UTP--glucose-1-phosphate uridylyltransferase [Clostridiales bacterium]|nr:UTP--glucose-1-phosphate uridylyltransferase [Clostridiales bacterium]
MKYEQELITYGQEHLMKHYQTLSPEEQMEFERQLDQTDWSIFEKDVSGEAQQGEIAPIRGRSLAEIAEHREEYVAEGQAAIKQGKLAAVLLAGGQGTRLGSSAPKGAFDIGVTRSLYIFQQQIYNLLEVCDSCGAFVPLLIMTSEKNDVETRAFLREHNYFGYPAEYIRFFVQDSAPCIDFDGKILLEARGKIALSPNGNGGWYSSLVRAGLLNDELLQNVAWFNVFAVDNVLQRIADPVFLGATLLSGCKCGAKVVKKCCPEERAGVLCLRGGLPDVVEYYEMDEETAALRDGEELLYRYGVILNYLFDAETLQRTLSCKFLLHRAKKKVPYLQDGETVIPQTENAYKSETLILDMVRLAGSCLPFEVVREREFAPVKNKTGVDSVETARILLQQNGVTL